MQTMREAWTDERLDDLSKRMDEGFRRVDERFKRAAEQFDRVDERFDRVERGIEELRSEMNLRLGAMQRTMVHGVIAMSAAAIAGLVGIFGLIATQL